MSVKNQESEEKGEKKWKRKSFFLLLSFLPRFFLHFSLSLSPTTKATPTVGFN